MNPLPSESHPLGDLLFWQAATFGLVIALCLRSLYRTLRERPAEPQVTDAEILSVSDHANGHASVKVRLK